MATLKWSGRLWNTGTDGNKHPGYEWEQNILVDAEGHLHLGLVKKPDGKWYSSMLVSAEHMGYGTYQILADIHAIDPNAVLGFFVYTWVNQHEIDIVEEAQWGGVKNPFWQCTTQPSKETGKKASNAFDLAMPQNDVLFTMVWTPAGQTFTVQDATGKELKKFVQNIPVNATLPDPAHMYLNLYPRAIDGTGWTQSAPPATDQHYVIKSFKFTPLGQTPPPVVVEPPVVIPPVEEPPVVVPPVEPPVEPPVVVPPVVEPPQMYLMVNGKRFEIVLKEIAL